MRIIRTSDRLHTTMDELLSEIFEKLGGATAISRGTGYPVQTVHDWLKKKGAKPEIPPWRRPTVLAYARREGLFDALSDEAKAYLTSDARRVGRAA